jgi:pSer/pThr/pTyr-binding forkhead associated (FHA) protein
VPRFRLRYQNHDLEVPPGEFVVGRGRDCQLAIDDPLVSRRHASFKASADKISVEDLGSRNGVKVNHQKIASAVELAHGDVVTIGNENLVVNVSTDEPDKPARRAAAVTMTNEVGQGGAAIALLSGVVDKALGMGRIDEAERILTNLLGDVLARLQTGKSDAQTLTDGTRYAMRLASETGRSTWIDWVFNAYNAAGKVMPAQTVDELYSLARRIKYPVTPALRSYLETLRAQSDKMNPTEKFALQRIEGLVRVLLA